MNKKETQQQERGQSLVLVALAMIGLLAFAGLALDGGLAYTTRRVAQNAADSGAIAGTYELYQQKWQQLANEIDEDRILSEIHKVVESHGVPDTDTDDGQGNGNEINENVRAFYVGREAGSGCSDTFDIEYQKLCKLGQPGPNDPNDPNIPCNNTMAKQAVGISIEVDMPFEPIFAGFIGWNGMEVSISNRSTNFDQQTAAIVNAGDRGFYGERWVIFAMDKGSTSGSSTFIEVDEDYQNDADFAFANVHSQGSFEVGNHDLPIMGQVSYCVDCSDCFRAQITPPEQTQNYIDLPEFAQFATLAKERAEAASTVENGDTIWGGPIDQFDIKPDGVWLIKGDFTVPEDFLAIVENALIYVTGDVTINGIFYSRNLSIISDGAITINGTLINDSAYPNPFDMIEFQKYIPVLWSSVAGGNAISVTGDIPNDTGGVFPNDSNIVGAIIAEESTVSIASKNISTVVKGSVIGNMVEIDSNADTGKHTRIQYNASFFPTQNDRIELLK
jgi:hypothetical protein